MNLCPDCGVRPEVKKDKNKFYSCHCDCITTSGWRTKQEALQAWWKVIKLLSDIAVYGTSPLLFDSE